PCPHLPPSGPVQPGRQAWLRTAPGATPAADGAISSVAPDEERRTRPASRVVPRSVKSREGHRGGSGSMHEPKHDAGRCEQEAATAFAVATHAVDRADR